MTTNLFLALAASYYFFYKGTKPGGEMWHFVISVCFVLLGFIVR